LPRGYGVNQQKDGEAGPEDPQEPLVAQEGLSELAQSLRVVIEGLGSEIDLEVAEHVNDHEQHEDRTRYSHRVLLADRGAVQGVNPSHRSLLRSRIGEDNSA
jgi:hypothetical protein